MGNSNLYFLKNANKEIKIKNIYLTFFSEIVGFCKVFSKYLH